jgi:hypothetical protein
MRRNSNTVGGTASAGTWLQVCAARCLGSNVHDLLVTATGANEHLWSASRPGVETVTRRGGHLSRPTLVAVAVVCLGSCSTTTRPRPSRDKPARVSFYSDSLGYEARDVVGSELSHRFNGNVAYSYDGQPGAALCDFSDRILATIADRAADVVAIEFSGNGFTDCAKATDSAPLSRDALLERYRADAEMIAAAADGAGIDVVWIGAPEPLIPPPAGGTQGNLLDEVYRPIARQHHDVVSEAQRSVYNQAGAPVESLPCAPAEDGCSNGVVTVRSADGIHFCPAPKSDPTTACPVYSPGAFRFGRAIATSVAAVFGL